MTTQPSILLFRGRGLVSSLIRWQSRGDYAHAALLLPSGQVLESWQGAGVRVKTLTDWDGIDRFAVPSMTEAQWADALGFARSKIGAGYDYWGVARFLSRRRASANDRWFCSELVFAALAHAGVRLFERVEPWAVSPGLLALSPLLNQIPTRP